MDKRGHREKGEEKEEEEGCSRQGGEGSRKLTMAKEVVRGGGEPENQNAGHRDLGPVPCPHPPWDGALLF